MGTQKTNTEKYLELWDLFENEIKTSKKLTSNTLSGFAKYYEKYSDSSEDNDYKKIYDKLKKIKKRKDSLQQVTENSLLQLEEYFRVLRTDYYRLEVLPDESYENWFN